MRKIKLIVIVGPTASGKSALAVELAERFNGEIVSADSMQVYRAMNIGTAKPMQGQRERVAHHLIDAADPDEEFTAARYREEASRAIHEIRERGRNVFVVGGTGLYIRALTRGLFQGPGSNPRLRRKLASENLGPGYLYEKLKEVDPDAAAKIHPNNLTRVIRALEVYSLTSKPISAFQKEHSFSEEPYEALNIGISVERNFLYKAIEDRVDSMIKAGLAGEVRRLLDMGYSPDLKAMGGLGYKEMIGYIQNKYSLEYAVLEIKKNTRRYAKRQMTWFRREADIRWFAPDKKEDIMAAVKEFFG
ncbi:MAG: tRNA (adenosine(37)-N6)-dimethylallyltransferase MiaA [Deltaproteobacteria bacterium]|nr:tRNA (adenosine(37)-N6)-dimethylallyltransferase MiaA [Deltaproteobacteria bacterium]